MVSSIDKILLVSKYEVVIYYTSRPPFHVHCSSGRAYELAMWLFSKADLTLVEYTTAMATQLEDTCLNIRLQKV